MKKVLFATTALVVSAGFAAAEVKLTGSANMGLKDTGTGDTYLHNEIDFNIVASGESDNGLTFGASVDLDDTAAGQESFGDAEVFISGDFGTLTVGEVDVATDGLGLSDAGFDGIGLDDDVDATRTQGSADLEYTYSFDAFTFIVTTAVGLTSGADAGEGDFAAAVKYKANGISAALGYAKDDSTGNASTIIELGYSADGLGAELVYHDAETFDGFGLSVSYDVSDALTLSFIGNDTDATGDDADFGVGFKYDLGGGLALAGAVGDVDGNTAMDLGFTMKF